MNPVSTVKDCLYAPGFLPPYAFGMFVHIFLLKKTIVNCNS